MSSTLTDQLVGGPTGLKLRKFVEGVESVGELKKISGANWDLEIAAVTEVSASLADSKALLFDEITGYPKGYRVLTNALGSQKRSALALGVDPSFTGVRLVRALKENSKTLSLLHQGMSLTVPWLKISIRGVESIF